MTEVTSRWGKEKRETRAGLLCVSEFIGQGFIDGRALYRGLAFPVGRTTSWRKNRKEGIPSIRRLWAQDIAFQGNRGRQSRKMMEVEHSASSKCLGAFERRRETSTREERWEKIEDTMETAVNAAVAAEMGKVHATIEKQMKDGMDRMLKIFNQAIVKIQEDIQEVKNGEKEAKATMRATARARAADYKARSCEGASECVLAAISMAALKLMPSRGEM